MWFQVSQVYRWITRYRNNENERPLFTPKRPGRPKLLTQLDQHRISEFIEAHPFSSSATVQEHLQLDCSRRTIRRNLHQMGIHSRKPAKKIVLTAAQRQARLDFANLHLHTHWGTTENLVTVSMDEKVFCTDQDNLALLPLWRRNGTRYEPQNIRPVRRSGRISCAFWGWISEDGPGELFAIPTRLTGPQYVDILDNILIPSVNAIYGEMIDILMVQDNSSVHKCRIVTNYIEHNPRLAAVKWPAKSPDLNPIENV